MGGRRRQYDQMRQRFYAAGAESLSLLGVTRALGGYACPQCLSVFSPQALVNHELTLEHAPPRRLGGKPVTLTCAGCNPRAGFRLEAALAREHDLENFVRGIPGQWRGTLVTGNESAAPVTMVRRHDHQLEITGHPELTHPERHRETFEYFERHVGTENWRFELRLRAYDPRLAVVGHLRTAFIAAFAKLGYAFLLNPLGARLRSQIENPKQEDVAGFLATMTERVDSSGRALIICDVPFPCLAVQMGQRIVILPWPPSGVDPYEALRTTPLTGGMVSGKAMEWPKGMELMLDKGIIARNGGGFHKAVTPPRP